MTDSLTTTGNPRNKTALKPGRSLMDWIRLTNSSADLSGAGGRGPKDVTLDELARHNKRTDAWMAIRGMVYNVTSYFEYHPGGEEELMRGAGTDATDLFDQIHKWVNYESMLKKCLVGRLKTGAQPIATGRSGILPPPPPPSSSFAPPAVTTDWMQAPDSVTIVVYTRKKNLDARHVSVTLDDGSLAVRIYAMDRREACDYRVRLSNPVEPSVSLRISSTTGKVELILTKKKQLMQWVGLQWPTLGDADLTGFRPLAAAAAPFFRKAILAKKQTVNHNVRLFTISFPSFDHLDVPIGHHVQLKIPLEDGSDLVRSYTPVVSDLMNLSTTDCPAVANLRGTMHFLIKIYATGAFTRKLDQLAEGDAVLVSDPLGTFDASLLDGKRRLVALAAGTGITPMIRLILDCLHSEKHVTLLFFNRKEDDIIWREEFDKLKQRHGELIEIWHILSEPEHEWPGLRGRISKSILASAVHHLDTAGTVTCVCGPSEFTETTLRILDESGYEAGSVHAFAG